MTYMRDLYDVMVRCGMQPPPFKEWHAHYTGPDCVFWPLTDKQQKLVGGVLFKGHMVHLAVDPAWHGRWINKTILRAFHEWTPEHDVFATPPKDNLKAIALCRRLKMEHRPSDNPALAGFEVFVKPGLARKEK